MSNDLVPQQLQLGSQEMEPVSVLMGSTPNVPMPLTGSVSNSHSSNNLATHGPLINNEAQQFEARGHTLSSHQFLPSNEQPNLMEAILSTPGPNSVAPSNKRKEMPNHPAFHHPTIPKKQRSQIRSMSSILEQQGRSFSASNVRTAPYTMNDSVSPKPSPVTNRKVVQMDSFPVKAGGVQQAMTPKNQKTQIEQHSNLQTESFESVRSKLRDSLITALEMVSEHKDKPLPNIEEKSQTDLDNVTTVNAKTDPVASNDASFRDSLYAKDDLLMGNGLSCALDSVKNEKEVGEKQLLETVVFQVEAELFKLFGGVNKKYKEKGRSLLFNLKDRNNPELRERVASGEISPKRLCSMSAEELASKELSQWRIAKAEELAQMKVLPDTDVDVRRLVRKTHKGEFQVDVEQIDEGALIEDISVGANSLSQIQQPNKRDSKENSENLLPQEGADPMQGLEFEESKDSNFLPPIVSLNEFMESLDSEPPFENLDPENSKTTLTPDKKNSHENPESKPRSDEFQRVIASDKVPVEQEIDSLSNLKSSNPSLQSEISISSGGAMGEHVWEGLLQISVSSKITVNCYFKSGEKTCTKEWPKVVEIKGKVRLNAFEKFIQDLPNSRTRSMMVVHFVSKDKSLESEQASLSEVSESYVSEERLGFAEPAPGLEIYLCPNHTQTFETLKKPLAKLNQGPLDPCLEDGLIGVVVSRKKTAANLTPSPHTHTSSKHGSQHLGSHIEKGDSNLSSSKPDRTALLHPPPPSIRVDADDEDDVPPGFGPGRDDDDLPEFKFSSVPGPLSGPVVSGHLLGPVSGSDPLTINVGPQAQQMRALIQLYGQGKKNTSWGDDEDEDDIPEWQPQTQIPPSTWGAPSRYYGGPRDLKKPMDWMGAPPRSRGF